MKNQTPTTASINGDMPYSETKRICKYSKCDKDISHLPIKYKYCTLNHRTKHHDEKSNAKKKKPRKCVVCKKPYDFMKRDRKWTCSIKCEKKHKNMVKANGWQKYWKPSEGRSCSRCGVEITARCHKFCSDCFIVNKEVMKFKMENR